MDLDSLSSLLQRGPSHFHEQLPYTALEVLDLCSLPSRTDKLLEALECLTLMEKILYCVGFVDSILDQVSFLIISFYFLIGILSTLTVRYFKTFRAFVDN